MTHRIAIVATTVLLALPLATTSTEAAALSEPQPSKAAVPGPTAPPKLPVVAQAKPDPATSEGRWGHDRTGAAVTINGFKADGHGLGTLYWTLRNENAESLGPGSFVSDRWGTDIVAPSGVNIVDGTQRHATLLNPKSCMCYINPPGIYFSSIDRGTEIPLAQVFAVSPNATEITVEIPGFHPVPNVPVQR